MSSRALKFTDEARDSYLFWQLQERKTLRRINDLMREVLPLPEEGIGKPERLRGNLSGLWSRRIDDTNQLVYKILDQEIIIVSCRYHY